MVDLQEYKIAVFTRSANYVLYKMSSNTLKKLPFQHYRLMGTAADGYLYDILQYDVDYAINIDEDAFVLDQEALLELLEYCISEDIINCGMRDGGVAIRGGNLLVTNPFFNILAVKTIRKYFSLPVLSEYSTEDGSDMEPYYPFFLWLNTNFKTLYLDSQQHSDELSTILHNQNGKPFLIHSWYSRYYGWDEFHTKRINSLYASCTAEKLYLSLLDKVRILFEKTLLKTGLVYRPK